MNGQLVIARIGVFVRGFDIAKKTTCVRAGFNDIDSDLIATRSFDLD